MMPRIDRRNVQIALLEMQAPMVASSRTIDADGLRRGVSAVVEASRALDIPVLASVVPLGAEPPALIEGLASLRPSIRTTVTPFGDDAQRTRLIDAGRSILALGGVSSEIALVNTALDARREGFEVHLLLDCCGGLSERTERAALRQMERAGVFPSNVSTFFTAMIDDMTTSEGSAVMDVLAVLWGWDASKRD